MFEKISLAILPILILTILTYGVIKKVPVYEEFVEGAKDGFNISVKIIPYLVALVVAVSMFRASGIFEIITAPFIQVFEKLSISVDIVPLMLTRSLSGSATLGLFSELAAQHGPNSFTTLMAAVMVGSSETTFYVLTVYFGSIGIKKFKYALWTGIIADIIGIVLAILVARVFFLANIG